MLRHVALHEHDGPLGIDARGEEEIDQVDGVAPQLGALLPHGDGVQVDGAVHAVVRLLQRHPVADGAQVVAEVQRAGRLDAAEDARSPLRGRIGSLSGVVHGCGVYRRRAEAATTGERCDAARRVVPSSPDQGRPAERRARVRDARRRRAPKGQGRTGCAAETLRRTERGRTGPWKGSPLGDPRTG